MCCGSGTDLPYGFIRRRERRCRCRREVLGRVTYESFAATWPSMTDEQGFAGRMNALPTFVAWTTLDEAPWNAPLIKVDVLRRARVCSRIVAAS